MFSQPTLEDTELNICERSRSDFQEAADGFSFVIKDIIDMAYNNVRNHFLWEHREQHDEADSNHSIHSFPSIEVEITAKNEIEANVSERYRNNRYVRLFEIAVRIKGIEYAKDSILWSSVELCSYDCDTVRITPKSIALFLFNQLIEQTVFRKQHCNIRYLPKQLTTF